MKIRLLIHFLFVIHIVILCGCAVNDPYLEELERIRMETPKYTWKSDPTIQSVNKDLYDIEISPFRCQASAFLHLNGCEGILLSINNKSNEDIFILWDKTFFLSDGQTNGTFMFEGIQYLKRNDSKPNDVVFGNSSYRKAIFPNNRVVLTRAAGWRNSAMKDGEWGVYLTMQKNDKVIHEKLSFVIYHE